MSKKIVKDTVRFIDLYLTPKGLKNDKAYTIYPNLLSSIYEGVSDSDVPLSSEQINILTSDADRGMPITPLRTAWEMGNKISNELYGVGLSDKGYGNWDRHCKHFNVLSGYSGYKGNRQEVRGMDDTHYFTDSGSVVACDNQDTWDNGYGKMGFNGNYNAPHINECQWVWNRLEETDAAGESNRKWWSENPISWDSSVSNFQQVCVGDNGEEIMEGTFFSPEALPAQLLTYRGWAGCTGYTGHSIAEIVRDWGNPCRTWHYEEMPNSAESMLEWIESGGFPVFMCHGKFFMAFSNVCDTGDYLSKSETGLNTTGCDSNEWAMGLVFNNMESTEGFGGWNGTMGSVAWFGPSDLDTDTRYNNIYQSILVDSMYSDNYREMGEIVAASKRKLHWGLGESSCPCTNEESCMGDAMCTEFYQNVYIHNGESSLPVWTGRPDKLDITVDGALAFYSKTKLEADSSFHQNGPWGRWKPRSDYSETSLSDELVWLNNDLNEFWDMEPLSHCCDTCGDSTNNQTYMGPDWEIWCPRWSSLEFRVYDSFGNPVEGITASLIYESEPPEPYHRQWFHNHNDPEMVVETHIANRLSNLLRVEKSDSTGLINFVDWNRSETWIEPINCRNCQTQLIEAGRYVRIYFNSDGRKNARDKYEQSVVTVRVLAE